MGLQNKFLFLGILLLVYFSIDIIKNKLWIENFDDFFPRLIKILPTNFIPEYDVNKKHNAYFVNDDLYSGVCSNKEDLSPTKLYTTIDIPRNMKVSYVIIYGELGKGRMENNKDIIINIYEKSISKGDTRLVAAGKINTEIEVDIKDKNSDNYLICEVDILDSVIYGGIVKVSN